MEGEGERKSLKKMCREIERESTEVRLTRTDTLMEKESEGGMVHKRERKLEHELSTLWLNRLSPLTSSLIPICTLLEPCGSAERGRQRIKRSAHHRPPLPRCCCCSCCFLILFTWCLPPISLEDAPNGTLQRRFRQGSLVRGSGRGAGDETGKMRDNVR